MTEFPFVNLRVKSSIVYIYHTLVEEIGEWGSKVVMIKGDANAECCSDKLISTHNYS